MSDLSNAFSQIGLDPSLAESVSASTSLSQAVDQFSSNQLHGSAADQIREALGTVLPPILRTPPLSGGLRFTPAAREWESVHYANDLINRQPKFKFLFKVQFKGFPDQVGEAMHFVTRCDKPKVQLNHTDVNYYNFRSRVLTSVTFAPLSITFLDEIGDSVNHFFKSYLREVSGQGQGYTGIDGGNADSSSSIPYSNGSSAGREIIVQQIFGNGLADNKFIFKNPRIESFDFDELAMDDSTTGSTMTLSFHYDALECQTGNGRPAYTWGDTDISAGGGTSNFANGGADTSLNESATTGSAGSINAGRSPVIFPRMSDVADLGEFPTALADLVNNTPIGGPNQENAISSAASTLDRGIQDTFSQIKSGFNLKFSGNQEASYVPPAIILGPREN